MDTTIFSALWEQVLNQPGALLVVLALSILAYLLEIWPSFPSRYIPHIIVVVGMFLYPMFATRSSVPSTYPNPVAVLVVNGFIAGFVATLVHVSLIAWAIKKFGGSQPTAGEPATPEKKGS